MVYEAKVKKESKVEIYLVKCENLIDLEILLETFLDDSEFIVESASSKKFTDIFTVKDKDFFFLFKTELENLEGRITKSIYLQQGDTFDEAKALLLESIDSNENIVKQEETKILAYIS